MIFRKMFGYTYITWMILMFIAFMLPVVIPGFFFSALFLSPQNKLKLNFFLLEIWARFLLSVCLIPFRIKGRENIDPNTSYIYVSNHRSFLDVVMMVAAVKKGVKPLAKIEIKKVPIYGWIYSQVAVLIDRKSIESRAQSTILLREELKNGTSIFIYPEGTRNRTSEPLQAFYDGAFRIAIENKAPILPMIMRYSEIPLPAKNLGMARPNYIECEFLPAISVSEYTMADIEKLNTHVRNTMLKAYSKTE